MKIDLSGTRRNVLGGLAALAGSPLLLARSARAQSDPDGPEDCSPVPVPGRAVPYKPQTSLPVRVRKSVFDLSAAEIARLQKAYAALKTLTRNSPNDPRGWLRQGHVHCWYCGGGNDGTAGPEIHGSWTFFPWHRAFLHFHERILCKLLGDDTFALPYWDWDSTGRNVFPPVYGAPSDPNPLADPYRSATPGSQITSQAVSVGILNNTMGQPTGALFMGDSQTSGAMENAPHGPVHIWTGDMTYQNANSDMGILATAAQDPVFFAHHGNIDRLWSVWLGLGQCHQNPTDPNWLGQKWQFYDENSVWTEISVAQVLDMQNSLQTVYQPPKARPAWTSTPCPTLRPKSASGRILAAAAPLAPLAVVSSANPVTLARSPVTRTVAVPPPHRRLFQAQGQNGSDQPLVLRLRGISVASHQQSSFHVFVNLPTANSKTDAASPNFVGTVTVLAKTKRPSATHAHRSVDAAFDVTSLLGRQGNKSQLSVTLVPVTGGSVTAAAANPTVAQITVEQR
jgi:polyphenol oxidase